MVSKALFPTFICVIVLSVVGAGQSGRTTGFSESAPARVRVPLNAQARQVEMQSDGEDVIRVPTDLVMVPVRISTRDGKPVPNISQKEFRIFEDNVEQQIAYFSSDEQPFTVALILDMSYSTVFQLDDIKTAARIFVAKLREHDRVMVIAFDEKPRVLCEPTSDRYVLRLAIDGAQIGSGTALYDTLDLAVRKRLVSTAGRRAVVLLSDGVDTASALANARSVERELSESDVLVYSLRYDTFEDVQRSRRKDAQIAYDEDDRPYVVRTPPGRGERQSDYARAEQFLTTIAEQSGGRLYNVSSRTNLNDAFSAIADELRRTYSLGYYPAESRQAGAVYAIKVRVYRPNLKIQARTQSLGK